MYVHSYPFLYAALFIPALAYAGWVALRWFGLPKLASEVYDANVRDGFLSGSVPREEYVKSYVRAERPVTGLCLSAAAFIAILVLPVLIGGFNSAIQSVNDSRAASVSVRGLQVEGIAGDFLGFVLVLGMNFVIVLGAIFAAYRLRGPSLRSEVRRLEEEYR